VADGDSLMALQAAVHEVLVREPVARYLLRVVTATRDHADLALGASPRGALSFFRACQARALIAGRDHVTPDDVQALAAPVLAHRVMLTPQSRYGGVSAEGVIAEALGSISVPT
jgi:MoxR-like ATPase